MDTQGTSEPETCEKRRSPGSGAILTEKNILIMEFMGENEAPYPLLKNTHLENEEAKNIFDIIVEYMRLLYKKQTLYMPI